MVSFSINARRSSFRDAAAGSFRTSPRVAYYFSLRVRDESGDVRMRYDAAFMIEWAQSVETALTLEIETNRRIWACSDECIAFLSRFERLDDFYGD